VDKDQMDFFKTEVKTNSTLDISLTMYQGDADLYVSEGFEVSKDNSTYQGETKNTTEHLSIENAYGIYYIGVYGYKDTEYSITSHTNNTYVRLVNGWP
jgi:hypothetical protein